MQRIGWLLPLVWGIVLLNSFWIVSLLNPAPYFRWQQWIHPDYNMADYREVLVFNLPFWFMLLCLLRMSVDSNIKRWGMRSALVLLNIMFLMWICAIPYHIPPGCSLSLLVELCMLWLLTLAFWSYGKGI